MKNGKTVVNCRFAIYNGFAVFYGLFRNRIYFAVFGMRRFRICYVDDNSEICNIKTTYVRIDKWRKQNRSFNLLKCKTL